MKRLFLVLISIFVAIAACQKEDINTGIDIEKYESQLNEDYSNALSSHKALKDVSSDSHLLHHSGTSVNSSPNQILIFSKSDSLFSEHFYDFCIAMMTNESENHMSSGGMMGQNGMMGGGNAMMGDTHSMDDMMELMESQHDSSLTGNDHYAADSLMNAMMSECTMMNSKTEGISAVFDKMQALRMEHRSVHGTF